MIYIASPYSHLQKRVENQRYNEVVRYFVWLCAKAEYRGSFIFSPIIHCHWPSVWYSLPTSAAFWADYNFKIIQACSHMHVLAIEGWEKSKGVQHEIKLGKLNSIEMSLVTPDFHTYNIRPFSEDHQLSVPR